jgi:hypothetical protein
VLPARRCYSRLAATSRPALPSRSTSI